MGFYYKISEAGAYIDHLRAGRAASINIYEMDGVKPGFWPIYKGRTNQFFASAEESKAEIESYLKRLA